MEILWIFESYFLAKPSARYVIVVPLVGGEIEAAA